MRKRYYAFFFGFAVWVVLLGGFGPYFLRLGFWPAWLITLAVAFWGQFQFPCPHCGESILRPRMTIGTIETRGWTQFPGRACTHCGGDTDLT